MYEATIEVRYLEVALRSNDGLLGHFGDSKNGGLYYTPDDGENLLVRQKASKDSDLPTGNSVAVLSFLRLSRMTANPVLEEIAVEAIQAFALQVERAPADCGSFVMSKHKDKPVGHSHL